MGIDKSKMEIALWKRLQTETDMRKKRLIYNLRIWTLSSVDRAISMSTKPMTYFWEE